MWSGFPFSWPDPDPGRDRGGARAGPAADQEQVQSAVREGAEGAGDGAVPLQRLPGVGHRAEGPQLFQVTAAQMFKPSPEAKIDRTPPPVQRLRLQSQQTAYQ